MKYISILLLLLGINVSLRGQSSDFKPRFMVGPIGGVNLSNVVFVPSIPQSMQRGYDAGVVFRADLDNYFGIWGLWLEVDYSKRGWKDRFDDHPDVYYQREMNYVHVPVLTHYSASLSPFRLTISGGPHFGYFLSDQKVTNIDANNSEGLITVHHHKGIEQKLAWGLGGGLGAEYEWRKWILGGRVTYYQGLGDFFNNTRSDTFSKSAEQIFSGKVYLLYVF